jgi:hypothetical protein
MGSTAEPLKEGKVPTLSINDRGKIIDDILELLTKHGLTSQLSLKLTGATRADYRNGATAGEGNNSLAGEAPMELEPVFPT